jgi:hypothetical protein
VLVLALTVVLVAVNGYFNGGNLPDRFRVSKDEQVGIWIIL